MYSAGTAKVDITPDCVGVGMMGWGDAAHRVRGVKRPLYVRAVALTESGSKGRLVIACAELCFITEALRKGVLAKLAEDYPALGLRDEEVLLTATHTHNSPGGHSKYLLYNLTIPGFQPEIYAVYRDGIVAAIAQAMSRLAPVTLRLATGSFEKQSKVAFNRSPVAWARNPEAKTSEPVDRTMTHLRIDGEGGRPVAAINWFPVHCTSIHRDFHYIHSDNKGVAAALLEEQVRGKSGGEFIALFAQGAAGDISPNFMHHPGARDLRGPFPNDEESCAFNAGLQLELAARLQAEAASGEPLTGPIATALERFDFSRIEIAPEFADGKTGMRTGPAAIGCNFMRGTAEGRGAPEPLVRIVILISRLRHYLRYLGILLRGKKIAPPWRRDPVQGTKVPFMESGRGRILGVSRLAGFFLPGWVHPTVRNLKNIARARGRRREPFTPQNLPLQLARVGRLGFFAVPAEFTTVAGRRLVATVQRELGGTGIERVILAGYSNAYSGYVTTCEEYQLQLYEGASTHFGMWTLAGYQTAALGFTRRVARSWAKPK